MPALVYPTRDTVRWRERARPLRWVRRVWSSWRRSASSLVMRRTSRRRSTSSWPSRPGPRVPMPPACWLNEPAPSPQPGQAVAQQGQLDLGPALGGPGVLGEDVEDHRRAVDGRPAQDLLQVALLGRREVVVEDHGVGVDGQADRQELLGLAPAEVGGRVGRGPPLDDPVHHVGAGRVHQQRQLVETGLGGGQGGVGEGDADQHDALPDRPGDQGVGERRVVRGHGAAPGRQAAAPGRTSRSASRPADRDPHEPGPPSWRRRAPPGGCPPGLRDVDGRRPPGPSSWAAAAAAALPVPQARVSPTPRSHTRRVRASGPGPDGDELHVDPAGRTRLGAWSRARPPRCRPGHRPGGPGGGCPGRPGGPGRSANAGACSGPRPGHPHVHRGPVRPDAVAPSVLHRPHPPEGGHGERPGASPVRPAPPPGPGSACRCRSSRPCPRRRWRRSMVRSAPSEPARIRITPSAPTPNRRSHRARTTSGPRAGRSSRSTRTRKSLPAPWCLVRCRGGRWWIGGRHLVLVHSPTPIARWLGDLPEPGPRSHPPGRRDRSNHTIRGSRRNHARCRRAKVRVRRTAWSTASSRGSAPPRRGPAAPGSRAPGGRCGTGPRAGRPGPGPRPGAPRSIRSSNRSAMRSSSFAGSRIPAHERDPARRVPLEPGPERRRTGVPSPASPRGHAARRRSVGRLDPAGGHRVERHQTAGGAARARSRRAALPPGPDRSTWAARSAATSGNRPGKVRSSTTDRR